MPPGTLSGIYTNSHVNAPAKLPKGKADVVIFSTGYGLGRSFYATLNEELASQGYVVAAMEHLYDTSYIDVAGLGEFWNKYNATVPPTKEAMEVILEEMHEVRVADTLFVLESLGNKDSALVKGLPQAAFSCGGGGGARGHWWAKNAKVAAFGHSLGGSTVAGAMLVNKSSVKLLGGINMDGRFRGPAKNPPPPPNDTIKAPFLIMGATGHNRTTDESWMAFWENVAKGWKAETSINGSAHGTYTDIPAIVEMLGLRNAPPKVLPPGFVDGIVGPINGYRAIQIGREQLGAFMGFVMRGEREGKLLLEGKAGAAEKWPEVSFL